MYRHIESVTWILCIVTSLLSIVTLFLSIVASMLSHVHHRIARPLGPPYRAPIYLTFYTLPFWLAGKYTHQATCVILK